MHDHVLSFPINFITKEFFVQNISSLQGILSVFIQLVVLSLFYYSFGELALTGI